MAPNSITLSDDQLSAKLSIGFPFLFYGNSYTDFYISSNGYVTFDGTGGSGCCSGQFLPDPFPPNNLIAFAWEDLNPSTGGIINYETQGIAPNRKLVVNFNDVPHCCSGLDSVTVQTIIYEGSNIIEIHTTAMPTNGGSHTMGVENIDGTDAVTVPGRNSVSWSASNDFVQFNPFFICNNIDTQMVTVNSLPPIADLGPDTTVCGGVVLDPGNSPGAAFIWSTGDSTQTITAASTGIYSVFVTSGCGSDSDTISVIVNPIPPVDLGNDTMICSGDTIILDAGMIPGALYNWSTGELTQAITVDTSGSYIVEASDTVGCVGTDTIAINVSNGPTAAFSWIASGLSVTFSNNSVDGITYLWDFGDGDTSTSSNSTVIHTYATDGTYPVMLIANSPCGSDTITDTSVTVVSTGIAKVIVQEQIKVYPNPGEGIFTIRLTGFKNENIQLTIFDLHGRIINNEALLIKNELTKEVDITNLPKGLYYVRLTTKEKTIIRKLVIL